MCGGIKANVTFDFYSNYSSATGDKVKVTLLMSRAKMTFNSFSCIKTKKHFNNKTWRV